MVLTHSSANFIDNFAYSIRIEYESIGSILEDSYFASAFESKNWITIETTVTPEEPIIEELPQEEVIPEKTMSLVYGNCDNAIMKVKDGTSGKVIENSVVQFFSESGNLLNEVSPKAGNFLNEPNAKFIKIWKEGYTPIVMDNPCVDESGLSGVDMFFMPEGETPPKIASIVARMEAESERQQRALQEEMHERTRPLTEREYIALERQIHVIWQEGEADCARTYGTPDPYQPNFGFRSMEQQFAYNECINRVQTWHINTLLNIDSTVNELGIIDLGDSREYETPNNTVGHIPETADPGEIGNGWFFGHLESPFSGEGNVFRRLPEIPELLREINEIGEGGIDIIFHSSTGEYLYQVTSSEVLHADELKISGSDDSRISLVTCIPRLEYSHRLIIKAVLVGVKTY